MSGFEIAGIVLGAFSLLSGAVKDAHGPYQKLKRWWSFGIAFEDFLLRLDTERVAFVQNLDNLLKSVNISDAQRQSLLRDAQSNVWNDPYVQVALRSRITDSYFDWYIAVLCDIREALGEIADFLPVGKIHQVDAKGFEDILFRARASFSNRKDRLLERIQNRNEDISNFLIRESLQHQDVSRRGRTSRSLASSRVLIQSQKKSKELYVALRAVWECKCPSLHSCGIAHNLDPTIPTGGRNIFSLLLKDGTKHHQFRIEEAKDDDDEKPDCSTVVSTVVQDISNLRHELAVKNKAKKFEFPKTTLKALGKSTVSFILNPRHAPASSEVSQTLVPTGPNPITPVKPKPAVKFAASAIKRPAPPLSNAPLLTNLCANLAAPSPAPLPVGFLQPKNGGKLLLYQDRPPSDMRMLEGLEGFLRTTPHRSTRVRVGLNILINLLSLNTKSPTWFPPKLEKAHVWILKDPEEASATPYFFHPEPHPQATQPLQCQDPESTRSCLLTIGILLLELLFGQTIEQQPEWNSFLGPDGKPNVYTDMCTAMEWQKKVVLEVGDGLPEAIQKCLSCDFGVERDLASPRFVQEVLDNVAEPLNDFLSRWNTKAASA